VNRWRPAVKAGGQKVKGVEKAHLGKGGKGREKKGAFPYEMGVKNPGIPYIILCLLEDKCDDARRPFREVVKPGPNDQARGGGRLGAS